MVFNIHACQRLFAKEFKTGQLISLRDCMFFIFNWKYLKQNFIEEVSLWRQGPKEPRTEPIRVGIETIGIILEHFVLMDKNKEYFLCIRFLFEGMEQPLWLYVS